MSSFQFACNTSDVPTGSKLSVEVGDRFLVVANVDGDYFCVEDVCTHDGGTLGDGELDGHCLICPGTARSLTSAMETRSACRLLSQRKRLKSKSTAIRSMSNSRLSDIE